MTSTLPPTFPPPAALHAAVAAAPQALPADARPDPAPLDVSGTPMHGGWLIRGLLMQSPSLADQRLALRMAYQAARWTGAGLALSRQGPQQQLLLTQWHARMPGAEAMQQRLAEFTRGLEIWRDALARARQPAQGAGAARQAAGQGHEHRIRRQILGGAAGGRH